MQVSDSDLLHILGAIREELSALSTTVDRRFGELDKELHGYRMVVRVFRWLGAITIAIITLRFGDIKDLF